MVNATENPITTVREGTDSTDMVETIFGNGVSVVSASYTGDSNSAGIFNVDQTSALGVTPGSTGVILSTGKVEDYINSSGQANQSTNTSTSTSGQNNNSTFNAAADARSYDASYLDVGFIPDYGVMTMQFMLSSKESPEFQNSVYQDFVGVWVNGQLVEMAIGNGDVDPGNVTQTSNSNLYNDDFNTEMDGFTGTLSLAMVVNSNVENSIRIGIAGVSDSNNDFNLLIAANSVQTEVFAESRFAPIVIRAGTFGAHGGMQASPLHMEAQVVEEIRAIFPQLDPHTDGGYSLAARRVLKGYEATIWGTAQAAT